MSATKWSCVFAALFALCASTVQAQSTPERIARVQRVGQYNEIEVVSSTDLPMGAMPLTLWVGTRSFTRYLHPKSGNLKIAIFYLTDAEFTALKDGDAAKLTYGAAANAKAWALGAFRRDIGVPK